MMDGERGVCALVSLTGGVMRRLVCKKLAFNNVEQNSNHLQEMDSREKDCQSRIHRHLYANTSENAP